MEVVRTTLRLMNTHKNTLFWWPISNTIHHLLNPEINKKPIINDIDFFFFNRRTELDFGLYNDDGFITQLKSSCING